MPNEHYVPLKNINDIPTMAKTLSTMLVNETGSWRNIYPVIDNENCTKCGICWKFCPDISINEPVANNAIGNRAILTAGPPIRDPARASGPSHSIWRTRPLPIVWQCSWWSNITLLPSFLALPRADPYTDDGPAGRADFLWTFARPMSQGAQLKPGIRAVKT